MPDIIPIAVLVSMGATLLATPLVRKGAILLRLTDNPSKDVLKIHKNPVPFIGGVGMGVGLFAGLLFIAPQNNFFLSLLPLFLLSLIFGCMDDLFWQQRSHKNLIAKIGSQLFLGCIFFLFLNLTRIIPDRTPAIIAGFLFLVIVNASNLNDGLDGLLGGIALISGIGFLAVFSHLGMHDAAILSAMLIGITAGFLAFNLPPASLFMGDNGSYLLGTVLALLGTLLVTTQGKHVIPGAILMIGMPLLNACFVSIRRICAGQSPLVGDRLHLYDMIDQKTGSIPKTILINYALHGLLVAAGVLLMI